MASNGNPQLMIVKAAADIQQNISIMLEAKAAEAEKLRSWICNHIHTHTFEENEMKLQQSMSMHQQVIAMLDGITRMNQGIVAIMNAAMPSSDDMAGESDHTDSDIAF